MINYCWLSQVILALVERAGGAAGLSNLFAVVMVARCAVSASACYGQTRRSRPGAGRHGRDLAVKLGPQPDFAAGSLRGVLRQALLALVVVLDPAAREPMNSNADAPWPRWAWIVTPLLFALWVNLHSSVYIGFAILGAEALGRLVEVAWNERRLPAFWHDQRSNRWILLGLLAAAGALLNPQGPGVVVETARLAGNPNLRTVSEWLPMTTTSVAARLFAGSWAFLFVISRLSQRRVRPVEVILLGGFSVGVLQTGRMIAWYVPVYVFVIMPHVAEIVSRRWPASPPVVFDPVNLDALPSGRSFRYTLFCAATIWAALALSHLTDGLLGAEPRPASSLYHRDTPPRWASTSRIIRPLVRSGTRRCWAIGCCGRRCGTTNRRWRYSRIATCTSFRAVCGWNIKRSATCVPNGAQLLARYQVSTLVVSKIQHPLFVAELRRAADWTIVYEDALGVVATRNAAR